MHAGKASTGILRLRCRLSELISHRADLLEFLEEGSIPRLAEGVEHCDRDSSLQAFSKHDSYWGHANPSSNEKDSYKAQTYTWA